MIHSFELGNVAVTPETGRTDRVKVNMSLKTIEGQMIDIDKLRHRLGNRKSYSDEDLLFTQPKQHGAFRPSMKVRAKAFSNGEKDPESNPLFGGKLHFFNQANTTGKAFLLCFHLDANLSLLARMQGVPRDLKTLTYCGSVPPEGDDGEYSLDRKSNWILAGKQDALFSPERWGKFTADALEGIREKVAGAIDEARDASAEKVHFSGENHATLSPEYLEIYWEFWHDNPVALVRDFIGPLTDFGKCIRVTSFRESKEGNCHSLSLEIKAGCYLRIYAKTNKRLRFEVVHDLRKSPSLLERDGPGGKKTQARRVSNFEELGALLEILRRDAAKIVNQALDYLNRYFRVEPSGINQLALIVKIVQAVSNTRKKSAKEKEEMTRGILELLRVRGCLHSENVPKELQFIRDALKREKILLANGNGKNSIYRIFPEGRHALQGLMNTKDSLLIPAGEETPKAKRKSPAKTP